MPLLPRLAHKAPDMQAIPEKKKKKKKETVILKYLISVNLSVPARVLLTSTFIAFDAWRKKPA